jgi:ABC-2 type transport system ATP-binding protein
MPEAVIELSEVTKLYKDKVALNSVSLTIKQSTVAGLVGPNGAGKTTLFEIIEGLKKPSSGKVLVYGAEKPDYSRMGVMFQECGFEGYLKLKEIIKQRLRFYDNPMSYDEIVDVFDLSRDLNKKLKDLSTGTRRRVDFALSCFFKPDLLILDEPTVGFDVASRQIFNDVINMFKKRSATILISSHYLEELERFCDEIIIIDGGRILIDDTLANLQSAGDKTAIITFKTDKEVAELHSLEGLEIKNSNYVLRTNNAENALSDIVELVRKSGAKITQLELNKMRLEKLYNEITGIKETI